MKFLENIEIENLNEIPYKFPIDNLSKSDLKKFAQIELNKIKKFEKDVKSNILPRYLYKYYNITSNESKKNFISSIENNYFYLSSPSDFNDPIDCKLAQTPNVSMQNIKKYMRNNSHLTRKQKNDLIKQFKVDDNLLDSIYKSLEFDKHGVCCFTTNYWSILMWSHYTDKHRGIFLKYDLLNDLEFFYKIHKVKYEEKYPEVDLITNINNYNNLMKLIITKFKDWKYEEEYRIHHLFNGEVKFKKDALKMIYFGCKTSDKNIKEIEKLMEKYSYNVESIKMKQSLTDFKLEESLMN